MNNQRGVVSTLFDFSFSSFLTTKIIKLLYALSMLGAGIIALVLAAGAFDAGIGWGIVALVTIAPLIFLIFVMYARVMMELMIVLFRISENVQMIADGNTRARDPSVS